MKIKNIKELYDFIQLPLCFPNISNVYVFIFYLRQTEFFLKAQSSEKRQKEKDTLLFSFTFLLHLPPGQRAVYLGKVPSVPKHFSHLSSIQEAILIKKRKRQHDLFMLFDLPL